MIEVLVGFFAIAGVFIFLTLFFTTDLGPATLALVVLVFWSFIAYHIGKGVLSLL